MAAQATKRTKNLKFVSETMPPTLEGCKYQLTPSEHGLLQLRKPNPTEWHGKRSLEQGDTIENCLPWAEMIHLPHTTLNFPAMMCSVRLPIHAGGAPYWATVTFTDKDILGVEVL